MHNTHGHASAHMLAHISTNTQTQTPWADLTHPVPTQADMVKINRELTWPSQHGLSWLRQAQEEERGRREGGGRRKLEEEVGGRGPGGEAMP